MWQEQIHKINVGVQGCPHQRAAIVFIIIVMVLVYKYGICKITIFIFSNYCRGSCSITYTQQKHERRGRKS